MRSRTATKGCIQAHSMNASCWVNGRLLRAGCIPCLTPISTFTPVVSLTASDMSSPAITALSTLRHSVCGVSTAASGTASWSITTPHAKRELPAPMRNTMLPSKNSPAAGLLNVLLSTHPPQVSLSVSADTADSRRSRLITMSLQVSDVPVPHLKRESCASMRAAAI